jgi:tetratricopeptide (TPR) repeat protein
MRDIIEGQLIDEANILETFSPGEASPTYWIMRSVESLVSAYPDAGNPDNWTVCEEINPHAFLCIESCQKYDLRTHEVRSIYNEIGTYELRHGNHQSAETLFSDSLSISEEIFGVNDVDTAQLIHNLGLVYDEQGKYNEAITQYQRALRIKEKAFGVDHINTANTINNLGMTIRHQGKYDEAITQYQRALRI